MSGNLLGSPKIWILGTKNKYQETIWALPKYEFWEPKTNVRKPSGFSKNVNFGHQQQISGNFLDYPRIWVLCTKNKCQKTFWALQKYEFWGTKNKISGNLLGSPKTMNFGQQKQMSGNLLGSAKSWITRKSSGLSKIMNFVHQKTNFRKPSGLSKNMNVGHQKQMSGNLLRSPKTWVLGTKNKCQEISGLSKNMIFGHQKQMSGSLLGCPKTWDLGTKNKWQETFWALQKHEFWAPKTNIRKSSGLSKNMSFGHQKQTSVNLLGSPKTWVLDTKSKCQETFWALQKYEFWASNTNVRKPSGLSKKMSFGHQNQMSGNLLDSPKTWVLGTKKNLSGNLLGSPKTWVLGSNNKCQETFWTIQKHEFWAPKTNVRKPSGLSKNMRFGHQQQMSGSLLGAPKIWVLETKNKSQDIFWALQKYVFWAPTTNVRKSSGLFKNKKFGHQKQMSGNLLDSPKTWVLGTKKKRKPSGRSKNMSFGHQKQMSGNLLGSPKIWVLGTQNKCQEIFWALQKHEFWAPKTNVRKPSGLSKNMSFGHQKQMSGNLLGSPKIWVLGTKNKCQETFWALQNHEFWVPKKCQESFWAFQKHEFWAPKTNVRKSCGLSKNMSFGHQNQMSGNLLGSPKHEFWTPKTNVRKPSGLSKNMSFGHQKQMSGNLLGSPKIWDLGTKNKCQEAFWALQKYEFWAPKTNVRKSSGLSKNMCFGHQQQMSGSLLGSSKIRNLGIKNKCQETFWALPKHEFWAPKTNVRKSSGLSKNMSFGHQKQMSGNLVGSPKIWVLGTKIKYQETFWVLQNMRFGLQKQMSGNLLGSPKTWLLGTENKCQETFWALQKHDYWAPKTNGRKSSGLSKNMNLGHQKQMSGNLLGSPKHEFWAPKANVRKPFGLSKNLSFGHQKQMSGNLLGSPKIWVLGTKNKCQETFWALQKHEFWAPKTNVRKPSGLSKNVNFGHQQQMSGNLLDSPKTWVLGTKNKCQETFWALQKQEIWAPKTNIRKPSGLSKNMNFGHQKQMSGNLLGSPKTWVLGTNNKCQETFWTIQEYEFCAPKTNVRKPSGLSKNKKFGHQKQNIRKPSGLSKNYEFWAAKTNVRKSSGLCKIMN